MYHDSDGWPINRFYGALRKTYGVKSSVQVSPPGDWAIPPMLQRTKGAADLSENFSGNKKPGINRHVLIEHPGQKAPRETFAWPPGR